MSGSYTTEALENSGEYYINADNESVLVKSARFTATLEFSTDIDLGIDSARTLTLTADVSHLEADELYLNGKRVFMSGQVSGDTENNQTSWSAVIIPTRPFDVLGFDTLPAELDLQFYEQIYDAENTLGYVKLGEFSPDDNGILDLTDLLNESTFNYYLIAAPTYTEIRGILGWNGDFVTNDSSVDGYNGNLYSPDVLKEPTDPFFDIYGKFGLGVQSTQGEYVETDYGGYTFTYSAYAAIQR